MHELNPLFAKFKLLVDKITDAPFKLVVLNVPNAMQNSQGVFLDGALLKTNTSLFLSYTVFYTSTTVTITFNQAVSNGQVYQINLLQYVSI